MGRRASSRYMAAAAASSAAASLPRPRQRAAATAVASVTRTISSANARSSSVLAAAFNTSDPPCPHAILVAARRVTHSLSQFFDADHLWLRIDITIALDPGQRFSDCGLGGLMGDHHHGRRGAFMAPLEARQLGAWTPLHHALDGDPLLCHAAGDGGEGPGPVVDRKPDIVAAFVRPHLRLLVRFQILGLG